LLAIRTRLRTIPDSTIATETATSEIAEEFTSRECRRDRRRTANDRDGFASAGSGSPSAIGAASGAERSPL
jgi:hypothetical protein